ncbi:MAG: DUF4349 domain-containing protein [Planctomycetes bacterium]|nr:DUF4349 domain-containing protein [Planctomycetota bacterium]
MKNALGVCLVALALIGGCASRQVQIEAPPDDSRALADDSAGAEAERHDTVPLGEAAPDPAEFRIERNGWIKVDVKDELQASAKLRRRAVEFDAIVMSLSTNSVTFKMPATSLEKLLKEIENTDKWEIEELDFSAWDRTGEYWSLEARIESTRAVRARIMDMIERAQDLNTLFMLEGKLEPVQTKLDQLEGTKRDIGLKAGRVDVKVIFD